jgi:hypothetical protein
MILRAQRPARTNGCAGKVPDWLPAAIRDEMPCRVIGLVRDPRDVFLSARAFVRARGAVGFGMQAGTTEVEDARNTAHKLLCSTRTRARPGREAMRS